LLRDLGVPALWSDIGGALWLLQPLGTEAGLWPPRFMCRSARSRVVAPCRLYHRGRLGWGAAANLAAALSVEQIILPLPFVAWLVAAPTQRRRAAAVSAVIGLLSSPRSLCGQEPIRGCDQQALERLAGLIANPTFYVGYPAVGLGLHSIPLAIVWGISVERSGTERPQRSSGGGLVRS
jgi:hypothetical protein